MAFFGKKAPTNSPAPAAKTEDSIQRVSLSPTRLSPIFDRLYLWIASVNLQFNSYQIESGSCSFAGKPIARHGKLNDLFDLISASVLPESRERFNSVFSHTALVEAFRKGRTTLSEVFPVLEADSVMPLYYEFRADRIYNPRNLTDTFLLYLRQVAGAEDNGALSRKQEKAENAQGINWDLVRSRKHYGDNSMLFEYDIANDSFLLHPSMDQSSHAVNFSRFRNTLESKSDFLVPHDSVRPFLHILAEGCAGRNAEGIVGFRTKARQETPFRHYRIHCSPLEETGSPSWLFGTLTDIEEDYRKQKQEQELALQVSTVVEKFFNDLFIIDVSKDTVKRLVRIGGSYRLDSNIQRFSDVIQHAINAGVVAPESVPLFGQLIEKGFIESKAGNDSCEFEVRLKLPGCLHYSWYLDTFTAMQGHPHQFIMFRRNIDQYHDAQEKQFALAESLRTSRQNLSMIDSIASMVEFRNQESSKHTIHVRSLARILLKDVAANYPQYNINRKAVSEYCQAATLHDIGKISIPDTILNKPTRLTPEEFLVMKTHTTLGAAFVDKMVLPGQDDLKRCCREVALHHHERWDGKGYPDGLVGDQNSIYVQAIGLADVYDALVSDRCYKPAYPFDTAEQMIRNGKCGAFNPLLLESMTRCTRSMRKLYQVQPSTAQSPSTPQSQSINEMENDHVQRIDDSAGDQTAYCL